VGMGMGAGIGVRLGEGWTREIGAGIGVQIGGTNSSTIWWTRWSMCWGTIGEPLGLGMTLCSNGATVDTSVGPEISAEIGAAVGRSPNLSSSPTCLDGRFSVGI